TEVLDAAARIVAAVDIPVLVDVDTGYGNAFNVERTVRELVRMGAAGCFLEDQVWPKRCGHMDGKRIVPLEEYLPKLTAARATGSGDARRVHAARAARRRRLHRSRRRRLPLSRRTPHLRQLARPVRTARRRARGARHRARRRRRAAPALDAALPRRLSGG